MKKISIIVPVYNVEKYIFECVDSLINQTYKNLEIILIDDSSPDNCPKICDEYAQKDDRIKVIHKPNGGLSDARNAGIEIASGEYLMFVDSDDYIALDMVEQLVYGINVFNAEIAVCDYASDEGALDKGINKKVEVISSKKAIKSILKEDKINTSASTKLFKTELFKNVKFPVGKIYEDYATIYKAIDLVDNVVYVKAKKYYYRPNPTGITGGKFYKKRMQYFEVSEQVISFIKTKYPRYERYALNRATRMAISFCRNISYSDFNDEEVKTFLIKFIRSNIFRYLFSGYKLKSKMYGCFIAIAPQRALNFFRSKEND